MLWKGCILSVVCLLMRLQGAELYVDLLKVPLGGLPAGFVAMHGGEGRPGVWKVVEAEYPRQLQAFSEDGDSTLQRPVLAQTSEDLTDERFPMLIYEKEDFQDFSLTTRFKLVRGVIEKMAGLVFRYQDPDNYYYVRASGIGDTFAFFKVVGGFRGQPVRVETPIPEGEWLSMTVEATGNRFRCMLNGKEVLPEFMDNTFSVGKIGLWTKSDAVSYFADTSIRYTPRVIAAQKAIQQLKETFGRLVDLKLFAPKKLGGVASVIASLDEAALGEAEDEAVRDCLSEGKIYYAKNKRVVTVTMPVRDRNGDPIAALRITMESFRGQTQKNALARALPVTQMLQQRILSLSDLYQ